MLSSCKKMKSTRAATAASCPMWTFSAAWAAAFRLPILAAGWMSCDELWWVVMSCDELWWVVMSWELLQLPNRLFISVHPVGSWLFHIPDRSSCHVLPWLAGFAAFFRCCSSLKSRRFSFISLGTISRWSNYLDWRVHYSLIQFQCLYLHLILKESRI